MSYVTWIIAVIAAFCCSSQGQYANSGHVHVKDTPLQVRDARQFDSNTFRVTPRDVLVAKEAITFRESPHNTPYLAIMLFRKSRYNGSVYFDASIFDSRNIAAKTWQPFQREINLEQILGSGCSELRWLPTLTASPSKQHIVMYGFGTGPCAEKLIVYGDRRSRVITTTGGHAAMGAALATVAVGESDNSTFDLFAFGGTECLDGKNSSCLVFTNTLRRLRIESSEACMNLVWHNWTVMDIKGSARVPTPRKHAQLFVDGVSLLLFGGVISPSFGTSNLHFLPDFWRYSLVMGTWVQLESNLKFTGRMAFFSTLGSRTQAAFLSDERILAVVAKHSLGRFLLYLCAMSPLRTSCTKNKYNFRGYSFYLAVGHFFFYLTDVTSSIDESFKVQVFRSCDGNITKIRTTSQIDPDIDAKCPAFQGQTRTIPALFVPHHDRRRNQYLFFAPAYINSTRKKWLAEIRTPTMSIWSMQYVSRYKKTKTPYCHTYIHKFNTPAPSHCSSVTYLNPSTALLYDRRSRIWCLSISTYSWTQGTTSSNHIPPHRIHHVAYKHRSMGMVLYGGVNGRLVVGDLWLFQLNEGGNCTGSWQNLTSYVKEGYLPNRHRHAVTEYGDDVIIFGGLHVSKPSPQDLGKNAMFILHIKSNKRVIVRNIEIVPPIPSRIDHTISLYTKTDLLLLGGSQLSTSLPTWETVADDVLLLTIVQKNHTIVAEWTVFFKLRIHKHTVLNNRIFSGYNSARSETRQFYLIGNSGQCPKGYQRYLNTSCRPCPVGYYSATIEQQCERCGNLTTTKTNGSTVCESRNPCTAEYCHGHGKCFVNKADYKPFCTCQFGYVASDQCKVPSVYLALMAAVVFATTVTILVIALYQFVRKRRALHATEIQLGNTNRDLQHHQKKLRRINRGTLVRWSDLTIREVIASGTCSKVLLAELGDMSVAVKQFPSYFTIGSLSSPFDVFIQEAEILRGLRHTNIVMFIGAGRDATSGCPFLVMEYLRRGSLHDVLHDLSNPIEHCDRLRFALDAARGLKYLHSSSPPQIHRDIKSPNLLVSDKWVVKVGDLETARFLATYQSVKEGDDSIAGEVDQFRDKGGRARQHSVSYTSGSNKLTTPLLAIDPQSGNTTGEVNVMSRVGMTCGAGTDRWRSPESIKKNLYTEKHDVYSFGVVLWEIFTRQTPYNGFTCSEDILDEIVNERKPIFPASAPYAYRHLAEQCMKTDAVDRPSIQRVVRELTNQIDTF